MTNLNKLNREFLESVQDLPGSEAHCANLSMRHITDTYKSNLLKAFAGKTVTVKGYLIKKDSPTNYTLGLAAIYFDGVYIDTIQHLNVYVDLLSNLPNLNIGGQIVEGKGTYNTLELAKTLEQNTLEDKPFNQCQLVEVTGISYSYRNKWSVGTERQVQYAANN
jgi:hypothetical protein